MREDITTLSGPHSIAGGDETRDRRRRGCTRTLGYVLVAGACGVRPAADQLALFHAAHLEFLHVRALKYSVAKGKISPCCRPSSAEDSPGPPGPYHLQRTRALGV